ncbi:MULTISPECIES: hypothetical protein [unclassified Treponema]|uniref:hypothetical protein n=1 Tax=unclassified Treponema TaxID=2638727 RepID=UPI0020A3B5C1|nr:MULTISPECIES: hypothetical protein [unclassified Treponema]UTC67784.1 hypothetical protein E4O06_03725 [Treponema sp. OMZ 789]UTC70509.1 hypothetical protein E4O01_03715 [Treponema sp. OMZ 790]UTC73221.1 hypothetical protein E4O02_03865 [Treponema sp. OMZ 791]
MKKICFILICLSFGIIIFAQSAEKVDEILSSEVLTKGQACYLVGTAAEKVNENDSYAAAFDKFKGLKMFKNKKHDEPIRLDEFSNLALQYSAIEQGLWYRAAKNPHYAFRQLKIMKIIPQKSVPSSTISPFNGINLLSKIMPKADKEK